MSLRRIAKLFAAQNANQVVVILQQLLLPPAFLHTLGTSLYGQWLALTAAIAYLGTFNYGLQTYTTMQMAIHYNRGEIQEAREVQSAGLRILLGAFVGMAALLLLVFLVPLTKLLHLSISPFAAHLTLYIMGMQVMSSMLFGFFTGSFMSFGEAHRGMHYANANQLLGMLAVVVLVLLREPFPTIAAGQVSITLLMAVIAGFDVGRRCPDLRPNVRYWRKGALTSILKPSTQYMLLASSNVLSYQLPILLMQRILGPTVVVAYTLTRTVYSMSRRLLYLVTNSLSQEITLTFGARDWPKLHRLYSLSERVILLMTPPITFASMLATELVLLLWVHKPEVFNPGISMTLGLTISILAIKEHKYQFQFSSNQVSAISWQTLVAYGMTSLIAVPFMERYGVQGYLVTWLISEVLQLFYLLHLNDILFAGQFKLNHKPVYEMLAILAVCAALFWWPVMHLNSFTYPVQAALSLVTGVVLAALCYRIFRVDELRSLLWSKFSRRKPAVASQA